MQTEKIQTIALEALEDLKAIDITTLNVRELTSITDVMIICTARSNRHAQSLAENVVVQAKKHKLNYIHMEGEREGEWIIVDLADVVVHVMTEASRTFYQLENLWEPIQQNRDRRS